MTAGNYSHAMGRIGTPAASPAAVDTAVCAGLLIWLVLGTFMQDYFFRLVPGTMAAFAMLFVVSARAALRSGPAVRVDGPFPALYVLLAATAFVLLLSFLGYPDVSGLPRSGRFIVRQAYFLVILPAALMTGLVLWRGLYFRLYDFCARYFVALAVAFMVADLATAYLFGSEIFRSFNGYSQFADKLVGSFVFTFLFMARVTHPERGSVVAPLAVLACYYAATKILTYGSLFQASTGTLIAVSLGLAALLRPRPVLAAQALLLILFALTCLLIVGTVSPELFKADFNSYWRFSNWEDNFQTLFETGFLGIGFGTPYFHVGSEDLQHALAILKRGADPWTASAQPYDLVFMRAQHNSFVNMFYRTGILGGTAFLFFNLIMLAGLTRGLRRGGARMRPHCLLALVMLTISIVQSLLHVGIETPGFLIAYGLTAALSILAAWPQASDRR